MDDRVTGELPDDYSVLDDPVQVVAEVLRLLDSLRQGIRKLSDALESAGLPVREWHSPQASLTLLSEQFPDITVDDLLTRLAEFAASHGSHWLHGDAADVERFREEVEILNGVMRSLRQAAQRRRVLPVRERGDLHLEQALGDARVGTALDLTAHELRDLDSLGPFIVPLTDAEWLAMTAPADPPSVAAPAQPSPPAHPPNAGLAGSSTAAASPVSSATSPVSAAPLSLPASTLASAAAAPKETTTGRTYTRLRDFVQPSERRAGEALSIPRTLAALRTTLITNRWSVVAVAILTLSMGTTLLALVTAEASPHLSVTPSRLSLTCSGSGAIAALTLRATGSGQLHWHTNAPSGLNVSAERGALAAGASTTIRVSVVTSVANSGTIMFSSDAGSVSIPFVVSCA